MANRYFNKQVSPKKYMVGGRVKRDRGTPKGGELGKIKEQRIAAGSVDNGKNIPDKPRDTRKMPDGSDKKISQIREKLSLANPSNLKKKPLLSKEEKFKPAKPGRKGDVREPTQAEVDARKARMNEARMEAHKKNKTGPFRVIPGRQKGTTKPKDKRTFEKLRQPVKGMMGGASK